MLLKSYLRFSTRIQAGLHLSSSGSLQRTNQLRSLIHSRRQSLITSRSSQLKRVAITGALSNSGRYISQLLLDSNPDMTIINLTGHPEGRSWASTTKPSKVHNHPFNFTDPTSLRASLAGVQVLFLTYWERFPPTPSQKAAGIKWPALPKIRSLIDAAAESRVKRVVYVSHTQPQLGAYLGIQYISGKLQAQLYMLERMPVGSSVAFVRPSCIFSDTSSESIVVNNMAAVMKKVPLFMVHGGAKRIYFQPVHVRDLAFMAVDMGTRPTTQRLQYRDLQAFKQGATNLGFLDAVGPQKPNLLQFLKTIREGTKKSWPLILPVLPASLANSRLIPKVLNHILDDDFVQPQELSILHGNVACSEQNECPAIKYADLLAEQEEARAGQPLTLRAPRLLEFVDRAAGSKAYWGTHSFKQWVLRQNDLGQGYINSYNRYYNVSGRRQHLAKMI